MSPTAEEARWRRDAKAAPEIWILSIGKSSILAHCVCVCVLKALSTMKIEIVEALF